VHISTFKNLLNFADQINMGTTTTTALESFYFRCRLIGCTRKTQDVYAERLGYLLRYADSIGKKLEELTKHDLQRYINGLIDTVSPVTTNGRIQVYRVFYNHLLKEGFVKADPMIGIEKVKQPHTVKRVVTPDELSRVLDQIDKRTFLGTRDRAIILLTFDAMLRLSELLSIKTAQLDLRTGVLHVKGKGRKERYVAFSPTTAQVLHTYITRFRAKVPGDLLFCTRKGGPIGHRYAQRIFSNPARKIGLHLHPHLVRHSGATAFVRAGGPLPVLQRALGHSTLRVTERYVHVDDSDLRNAYERFSPAAGIRV
jgi:site-specific recombinase XerD